MKHYNPSITERANRIFNLKNGDGMSEEIDGPVATIPINPSCRVLRSASAINATSGTIFTTPTDRDFYLVAAMLSMIKDVTSTSADTTLGVPVDGVTQAILRIPGISLTPQNDVIAISFPYPIKVDRNAQIVITNSSNVANIVTRGSIIGYYEEVTRT